MFRSSVRGGIYALALAAPIAAATLPTAAPHLARPGSINYVEGQASIGTTLLKPAGPSALVTQAVG